MPLHLRKDRSWHNRLTLRSDYLPETEANAEELAVTMVLINIKRSVYNNLGESIFIAPSYNAHCLVKLFEVKPWVS